MKSLGVFSQIRLQSAFLVIAVGTVFHSHALAQFTTKAGSASGSATQANNVNANWYYDWGLGGDIKYGENRSNYIPMFWGSSSVSQANIDRIRGGGNTHILGFNEPERADQANMSVATALTRWKSLTDGLAGSGIKKIGPAVSDTVDGRSWLANFMSGNGGSSEAPEVDAIAFHWYGASTPNNVAGAARSFLNRVDSYHSTYNKPVWITEFAIHDWGGNYSAESVSEANRQFLEIVVPGLERRSHVEGYAFYPWFDDSRLHSGSGLTTLGEEYSQVLNSGDNYNLGGADRRDIVNLRGGILRNSSQSNTSRIETIQALGGASTLSGGGRIKVDDWVRIRQGANLNISGNGVHDWKGAGVVNDGMLRLSNGRLKLARGRGVDTSGGGKIVIEGSGILETGGSNQWALGHIKNDLDYNGGTVESGLGHQVIDGSVTVLSETTHSGTGVTHLRGDIAGSGRIVKNGNGVLNLSGQGSAFSGEVRVNEGTLLVNSISGSKEVTVLPGGTVGGVGKIVGDLYSQGGVVNPGRNTGINEPVSIVKDLIRNGSFQATENTVVSSGDYAVFKHWQDEDGDGAISLNVNGTTNVPGDNGTPNNVYQLRAGSADSDAFHQDLGHAWSDGEVLTLSFNAMEVPWQAGENVQNSITIEIQHEDSTTVWSKSIDLDGLRAEDSWDSETSFSYAIDPSQDFINSTNGSELRISVLGDEGRAWIDNLALTTDLGINRFFTPESDLLGQLNIDGDYVHGVDSILLLDIVDNANFDRLVVGGDILSSGGELQLNYLGNGFLEAGDSFDLLDFDTFNGEFDSISLPELNSGLAWDSSGLYTTGSFSVIAVPEPSTPGTLLLASMAFGFKRRRAGYPQEFVALSKGCRID